MNGKKPKPPRRCIVSRPPGQMPRVVCPPPTPKHFIAALTTRSHFAGSISSPLGGPASGLSVGGPVVTPPAPNPTPMPSPPPGPTCVDASIFSDCFPCTGGPITGGAPGPACGWTFSEAFGPKGGSVSFASGMMNLITAANNEVPAATKPIALASVNNLTGQWIFTEFAAPTGLGNSVYETYVVAAGIAEAFLVRLTDDGSLFVLAGPTAAAGIYSGAWTPNNGTHNVHLTIDGAGVPLLWIDGASIPLAFIVNAPIFLGTLPANVVAVFAAAGPAFPDSAEVTGVFLTSGNLPPTTEFCCV